MRGSDSLGPWLDLAAHHLSQPVGRHDPMLDICAELSIQFGAPGAGTIDLNEKRARIGAYRRTNADPADYVARVGDHPLAMHFRATGDRHARSLHDARRFFDDPWARVIVDDLRQDEFTDFVFLPLDPPRAGDHRWLAMGSNEPFGRSARYEIERVAALVRALDAQSLVLAGWHSSRGVAPTAAQELSSRELAVLALVARGLTAAAIGFQLHISPRTVTKHQEHIYRKLDVGDRLMAVIRADELGILPLHRHGGEDASVRTVEAPIVAHGEGGVRAAAAH